jgi:hypothetical protein
MGWSEASIAKQYMHVSNEVVSATAEQVGLIWIRSTPPPRAAYGLLNEGRLSGALAQVQEATETQIEPKTANAGYLDRR